MLKGSDAHKCALCLQHNDLIMLYQKWYQSAQISEALSVMHYMKTVIPTLSSQITVNDIVFITHFELVAFYFLKQTSHQNSQSPEVLDLPWFK